MKKMIRALSASVSILCIASACMLPASAGTLTAEELFLKYDHSAYMRDASGQPFFAADAENQAAADAGVFFNVRTCGYDLSYPDAFLDMRSQNYYLDPQGQPVRFSSAELYIFNRYRMIFKPENKGFNNGYSFLGCTTDDNNENTICFIQKDGYVSVAGAPTEFVSDWTDGILTLPPLDENGTLTIPETFNGLPVKEIADGAFWFPKEVGVSSNIRSIIIPDSVEVIGWHAFDNAIAPGTEGASIHLPASLKTVYPYAFNNVGQYLDTTQYPESVEYIGRNAVSVPDGEEPIQMQLPESLCFVEEESRLEQKDVSAYIFHDDNAVRLNDAAEYYLSRDINGDGCHDIKDAVLLSRYVGGDTTLTEDRINLAAADFNGDGSVNAADLTKFMRMLARLE